MNLIIVVVAVVVVEQKQALRDQTRSEALIIMRLHRRELIKGGQRNNVVSCHESSVLDRLLATYITEMWRQVRTWSPSPVRHTADLICTDT